MPILDAGLQKEQVAGLRKNDRAFCSEDDFILHLALFRAAEHLSADGFVFVCLKTKKENPRSKMGSYSSLESLCTLFVHELHLLLSNAQANTQRAVSKLSE